MTEEKKDVVEQAIDQAKPLLANVGFGSIMGYCSGYALKRIGRAVAFVVGVGFVGLQAAATMGYIEINWSKFKDGARVKLDITKDGKVDGEDAKEYWRLLKEILTHKVPSAGGFSVGFLYGAKSG